MNGVFKMQQGITGAGVALGAFCLLVLLLRPRRALHHTTSPPLMFTILALALNVAVLFGTFGKTSGCRNKYTSATWDDSKCVAQGFFFVYIGLAITTWWTLVIVNIILVVFSVPQQSPFIMNLIYHGYGWGFPMLICIIALAKKGITSVPGGGPCFLDFTIANGWFADAIFYFPVGIITEVMLIALGLIAYRLRDSWTQSGQTRLVLFGVCYGLLGNYNLSYRMYTRHFSKRIEHSLFDWFNCSFVEASKNFDPYPKCQPTFLLNYPMFVILTICVFLLPLFSFIFFILTQENWQVFKYRVIMRDETSRSSSRISANSGNSGM